MVPTENEYERLLQDLLNEQERSITKITSVKASSIKEALGNLKRQLITDEQKKVHVDEEDAFSDILHIYKDENFDPKIPLKIKFNGQPAVGGGVLRHVYTLVFRQMSDGLDGLTLFEGSDVRKLPVNDVSLTQLMEIIGKIFAHAIVQVAVGPTFFSPSVYKYLCTGDATTIDNLSVDDASARVKYYIGQLLESTNIDQVYGEEDFRELLAETGTTVQLTVANRNIIMQNLLFHDVIGKRKLALDSIRKGLTCLGVLSDMEKYSEFYEDFFIYKPVPPEDVIRSLNFGNDAGHVTAQFLQRFITNLDAKAIDDFLFFTTASRLLPIGEEIKIEIKNTNAIFSKTCFNRLELPNNWESFSQFQESLLSAMRKAKGFTSV